MVSESRATRLGSSKKSNWGNADVGAVGIPSSQSVKANPTEGIRWTFEAATNRDAKAFLNMSKALQNGIGVSTNLWKLMLGFNFTPRTICA